MREEVMAEYCCEETVQLKKGPSPKYRSSWFVSPAASRSGRHLKHSSAWPKSPKTPNRMSLGRKHEGMAGKYQATEPAGDRGRRVTILSIDGGGVRGVIPAIILEQLEALLQVNDPFSIPNTEFLFSLCPGTHNIHSNGSSVSVVLAKSLCRRCT